MTTADVALSVEEEFNETHDLVQQKRSSHGYHDTHGHSHCNYSYGHHSNSHNVIQLSALNSSDALPTLSAPIEDIFSCAKSGNLERFKHLIQLHGSDIVKSRDSQGHTVLHWIAQRGTSEFIQYAHSIGAPLNLPSEDTVKLHPIHWACSTGNLTALKTFVKLGVDINTVDATKNRTPLLIAAQNGFPLLVIYCVKNGGNASILDIDEDSPIHWAAYKGATEIVSVFQYLGLKTDQPDCYGQTPLHLAAMRGNFSTVQYLVEELDCRLDSTDVEGRTPFQLAKIKGHEHVAKYLARRIQKKKINIFSRWETSRMPYFFVLSNIPLAIFIYINCILPSMPESRKFFVWHFLINVFTWVFFFKTKMTHPGNVRADEKFTKEYDDITENIISDSNASTNVNLDRPLCHSCHVQRPLRSKHCRVCKTCIHHFDHHCPFVDNCVGRDNYAYFFAFVMSLTINVAMMESILLQHLNTYSWGFTNIGLGLYYLVILLPLINLFGLHIYLSSKNLTTNEMMNSHRYEYLNSVDGGYNNPFNQGIVRNLFTRLIPASFFHESKQQKRGHCKVENDHFFDTLLNV